MADRLNISELAPWYLIQADGTKLSGFLTVHPFPTGDDWNETDSDALKQWLSDLPTAWERLEEQALARWAELKRMEIEGGEVMREAALDLSKPFAQAVNDAQSEAYTKGWRLENAVLELNAEGYAVLTTLMHELNDAAIQRAQRNLQVERSFVGSLIETPHTHDQIAYWENRIQKLQQYILPEWWGGDFATVPIQRGERNRLLITTESGEMN